MRFTRTLKKTDLGWLILIIGLFIFLPLKVLAGPVDSPCWSDYPTGGTPIPGFPNKSDIKNGLCKADFPAFAAECFNKPGAAGVDSVGFFGCDPGLRCCLYPSTSWKCANNYGGALRPTIDHTDCFKTDAQCVKPNSKITDGAGCNDTNGGPVCCAIIKGSTAATAAGSKAAGAVIPQTGSTAEWQLNNPKGTGLQLMPCTKDGNCTIDDIVNQGVNFAKWIMGLAGALFLLVFVYGGAMYAVSFGRSDYVTKGKNAMTRGVFGIILVMGAWTVVSYVSISLGYKPVSIGTPATDQTVLCANDATAMKGCVTQSAKCLDWCNQVFIETSLSSKEVAGKCSDGPANACKTGEKCCILNR